MDLMFRHGMTPTQRLIWLKKLAGGGGGGSILKTVTGSLLHITDALAKPAHKFTAMLEPIQDLHGQDAPYPAGGGANIWDEQWEVGGYNDTNGNVWNTDTRIRSKPDNYISVSPSTSYFLAMPSSGVACTVCFLRYE